MSLTGTLASVSLVTETLALGDAAGAAVATFVRANKGPLLGSKVLVLAALGAETFGTMATVAVVAVMEVSIGAKLTVVAVAP